MSGPIPESYWVEPGRLAAGEYPGAHDPDDAAAKVEAVRVGGVTSFVDLTEEHELEPYESLLDGARRVRLPIRDGGVPTVERMREILDRIDAELARGEVVYAHCWGGHGRTGTVVGCWLVRNGMDANAALDRIKELRKGTPDSWHSSPETEEQRDFVRSWAAPPLGDRFARAVPVAVELHGDQRRKGTDIPYVSHLLSVCGLVLQNNGSQTEAIAALLHDAAEDRGGEATLARLETEFGREVARIVAECSDTFEQPKPPWRERKERYLAHLHEASASALRVSLADKLDNARAILADYRRLGPALWERFDPESDQLWYYRSLVDTYRNIEGFSSPLVEELNRVVSELEALVGA